MIQHKPIWSEPCARRDEAHERLATKQADYIVNSFFSAMWTQISWNTMNPIRRRGSDLMKHDGSAQEESHSLKEIMSSLDHHCLWAS